jgi:hypothetical protein
MANFIFLNCLAEAAQPFGIVVILPVVMSNTSTWSATFGTQRSSLPDSSSDRGESQEGNARLCG